MFQKAIIRFSEIVINPFDLDVPKTEVSSTSVSSVLTIVFGVLGVVAAMVVVISGMMFVLSRGNPEKAAKARRGVIYAAVGLILAMLAVTIVRTVTRGVA